MKFSTRSKKSNQSIRSTKSADSLDIDKTVSHNRIDANWSDSGSQDKERSVTS